MRLTTRNCHGVIYHGAGGNAAESSPAYPCGFVLKMAFVALAEILPNPD
jgi:hypothetical protein